MAMHKEELVKDVSTSEEKQLVFVLNDKVVVSSRDVAEHFEKEHKIVLRSIRTLLNGQPVQNCTRSVSTWFYETTYMDQKGEERLEYLMDRNGFSLLVMGFTGQKALEWKLKYIEAFNKMEEVIRNNMKAMTPEEQALMHAQLLVDHAKQLKALQEFSNQQSARLTAVERQLNNPFSRLNTEEWKQNDKLNEHEDRISSLETAFEDKGPAEEIKIMINEAVEHYNLSHQDAYNKFYGWLKSDYGINLSARLTNLKKRIESRGQSKTKASKLTILDAVTANPDTWEKIRDAIKIIKEGMAN